MRVHSLLKLQAANSNNLLLSSHPRHVWPEPCENSNNQTPFGLF